MTSMSPWEKRTVFLVAGLVFGLLLALKIASPDTYHRFIQEDGALETIQAAAYFLAALLAWRVAATRSGPSSGLIRFAYLALACGLLFVAIEEISWGQRLFDIATPEWFRRHSSQNEINIHNLYPVQRVLHPIYIAVGLVGGLSWLARPLGLADRSAFIREVATQWYTSAYFLICSLIYIGLELAKSLSDRYGIAVLRPGDVIVWRDQEVGETMLAMGFLMFLATKLLEEARLARSTRLAEAG
ncbi:hypothetical protein [Phreatobacter sp.]|uniref:hypothetical protein n=1 Tax=Phreatobacter sp. TaxID=1966341 RepID=UPI0022BDC813|nr:hypothetical protein [Phreatobacter sp.]MCZ8313984.1 hypothetical protein [Phreatobacter sp.]